MILYLSGPITGVKDFKERFREAETALRDQGEIVINPATKPEGLRPADYIRASLAELEAADGIVLLPGAALSRGAIIESLFAAYCGKEIFGLAKNPLTGEMTITKVNETWLQGVVATGLCKISEDKAAAEDIGPSISLRAPERMTSKTCPCGEKGEADGTS